MITRGNNLYVAGQFDLCNGPENIGLAQWDGSTWTSLGSFDGPVNDIIIFGSNPYIFTGGSFSEIDGADYSNIARYDLQEGAWGNAENRLSVDAQVNSMVRVENRLLIGGDFNLLNTQGAEPEDMIEARYLAYWEENDWQGALENELSEVSNLAYLDGTILVGGDLQKENSMGHLRQGIWYYTELFFDGQPSYFPMGDNKIHGFIDLNDQLIAYGGIGPQNFSFFDCSGFAVIRTGENSMFAALSRVDNTVRAITKFQNDWIIAGDFNFFGSGERNNIVSTSFIVTATENAFDEEQEIFYAENQIHLKLNEEVSQENLNIQIYDLQGKLIKDIHLPKGQRNHILDFSPKMNGIYIYKLSNGQKNQGGKLYM